MLAWNGHCSNRNPNSSNRISKTASVSQHWQRLFNSCYRYYGYSTQLAKHLLTTADIHKYLFLCNILLVIELLECCGGFAIDHFFLLEAKIIIFIFLLLHVVHVLMLTMLYCLGHHEFTIVVFIQQ